MLSEYSDHMSNLCCMSTRLLSPDKLSIEFDKLPTSLYVLTFTGISMLNVDPSPFLLSMVMLPFIALQSRLLIHRPRPVPPN
jgi:hypothetical protein